MQSPTTQPAFLMRPQYFLVYQGTEINTCHSCIHRHIHSKFHPEKNIQFPFNPENRNWEPWLLRGWDKHQKYFNNPTPENREFFKEEFGSNLCLSNCSATCSLKLRTLISCSIYLRIQDMGVAHVEHIKGTKLYTKGGHKFHICSILLYVKLGL